MKLLNEPGVKATENAGRKWNAEGSCLCFATAESKS